MYFCKHFNFIDICKAEKNGAWNVLMSKWSQNKASVQAQCQGHKTPDEHLAQGMYTCERIANFVFYSVNNITFNS